MWLLLIGSQTKESHFGALISRRIEQKRADTLFTNKFQITSAKIG